MSDVINAQNHTILLVDDNPANLSVVMDYLAGYGFQIMIARDGETGLRLAQQDRPDLILLDVRLPGIDGFEVCRRLKADELTQDIPVIFMTVAVKMEDKVRGFEAGGVDYITKPFQQEEVLARVTTHLHLRNLTRRLEEANESLERRVAARTAALAQANQELQAEIAERERAEAALRDSEERLRLTMEAANIGGWDWDVQNDLWYVSPVYYTMLGYEPKAGPADRQEWLERVHPEDRAFVAGKIQSVLAKGTKEHRYQARLRHADGTYRWQYVSGFGIQQDDKGIVTRMLGIRMDITEQKQAEQALRESEERFRRLAENAPDVVYRMSLPDGVYEYVSPAATEIFGYTPEELYSSPQLVARIIRPDYYGYFEEQWSKLLRGEMPPTYEYPIISKGGDVRWMNQRNILVRDDEGRIIAIEGIVTDVTDRKQAEEEIRRLNHELEQRVLARTAQLEAANKELEAFAYSVSHDLRAPLRHIDGYLELLQQRVAGMLDERSRHYMANITGSAQRMGMLIDDLLTFSRMGRFELSKSSVDLAALVQDIIRELEPEARDRAINWRIAALPTVSGDRAMLRLVLVNLISNALKFTRGCEQVNIEIGCETDDTENIIFVRDNGIGFDMTYVEKLFGVFQRLHHADDFEGTGIGLASVRRIILRHGGRTWAEGQINQGATFYFSLPQIPWEG